MQITMNDSRITTIAQLKALLKGSQRLDLSLRTASIAKKYIFIDRTVDRLGYPKLSKKDKRLVISYLKKLTGYKPAQLYRLIRRAVVGKLSRKNYQRVKPCRIYTSRDIKLLEETDEYHQRLNALATRKIMWRETDLFGKSEYQTIARVSLSHVYNLRRSPVYKSHWVNHTKPRVIPIGITQPPENHGLPGSLRVDTVHQREIYHINAVDEVTQWETVVAVPTISEQFLKPALALIESQCPFVIFNFHSDRGGEYINYLVAQMLSKLKIKQTKSRSRHPNDNALVETKNGSVIRKHFGWEHLDNGASDLINEFYRQYFNPYLNYHRPSLFVTSAITDKHGRQRKLYQEATVPYEKLKEVCQLKQNQNKQIIKAKTSFKQLNKFAYRQSDNEFAKIMQEEKTKLFNKINKLNQKSGSRRKSKP